MEAKLVFGSLASCFATLLPTSNLALNVNIWGKINTKLVVSRYWKNANSVVW